MADWLLSLAPPAGRGYLRLVAATSRVRSLGEAEARWVQSSGQGALWASWHNRLLGPLLRHRGEGAGVVISQSRDGELITRVVEGFGFVGLRGSSSRGGLRALREVLRHLEAGRHVVFTPDGPRGPRYTVRPGIAYAARRSGCPVVPVGVAMTRKAVFRSWDRFQVPLPFGTVLLVYGAPLRFGPDEPEEQVAEAIRAALAEVNDRAEAELGVTSP